jgi:hypothetical protein
MRNQTTTNSQATLLLLRLHTQTSITFVKVARITTKTSGKIEHLVPDEPRITEQGS